MKPDITTATARVRGYLDRRQFIRSASFAIGGGVIGSVVGQAVLDPILEPVAEPIREALYGRRLVETYRATPLSMARLETHGGREQRAALEAWRLGLELPAFATARATLTYPGPAGDQWVDWQGGTASRLLWGGPQPRHVPMRERPDRAFGAWAERRIADLRDRPEPVFMRVVGEVERGGETEAQDYSILALPYPGRKVLTVSATWPGRQREIPRRAPTMHSRASEGRDRDRRVSI